MAAASKRVAPITVETRQWRRATKPRPDAMELRNCGCYLCVRSSLRTTCVRRSGRHQPIVDGTHLARFVGRLSASIRGSILFGGFGLVRFWCLHCLAIASPRQTRLMSVNFAMASTDCLCGHWQPY